ncbi:MAG: class I SAM-dependent methyltransferase [bacterium]|nr:class I SAM-dependent methyltransferase [bacterium]
MEYTHIPPIDLLKNIWRVLTDSGRLIIVTPNRLGTWARFDETPFGHGHPYTSMQLSRLLKKAHFTLCGPHQHALFTPPGLSKRWPKLQNLGERWGRKWIGHGGGVLIQEAEKSTLEMIPSGQKSTHRSPLKKGQQLATPSTSSSSSEHL